MSGPNIRITVQLGHYPDQRDKTIVIPIDEYALREPCQPLDFPSPNADPLIAAVFCTRPADIRETKYRRKELADAISEKVKAVVAEMFEANDTVMGYKPNSMAAPSAGENK